TLFQYAHAHNSITGCAYFKDSFYNASVNQFAKRYHGKCFVGDICCKWNEILKNVTRNIKVIASKKKKQNDSQLGSVECLDEQNGGTHCSLILQKTQRFIS